MRKFKPTVMLVLAAAVISSCGILGIGTQEDKTKSKSNEPLGTISGFVYVNSTLEPLIGASVVVMGIDLGAITNVDGAFTIRRVPVGLHKLEVSAIGFVDRHIDSVVIGEAQFRRLIVGLEMDTTYDPRIIVEANTISNVAPGDPNLQTTSPNQAEDNVLEGETMTNTLTDCTEIYESLWFSGQFLGCNQARADFQEGKYRFLEYEIAPRFRDGPIWDYFDNYIRCGEVLQYSDCMTAILEAAYKHGYDSVMLISTDSIGYSIVDSLSCDTFSNLLKEYFAYQ